MRNHSTQKLVLTAVFAAVICVVTFLVKFPVPGTQAYVNAGDGFLYATALVLGGPLGAIAGGVGSALADLLGGYLTYAPATLVIKALMGLVVGLAHNRRRNWALWAGLMVAASMVMTFGYFLYEIFVYGQGQAITNLPFNLIQAAGGVILGLLLGALLDRVIPKQWKDLL